MSFTYWVRSLRTWSSVLACCGEGAREVGGVWRVAARVLASVRACGAHLDGVIGDDLMFLEVDDNA